MARPISTSWAYTWIPKVTPSKPVRSHRRSLRYDAMMIDVAITCPSFSRYIHYRAGCYPRMRLNLVLHSISEFSISSRPLDWRWTSWQMCSKSFSAKSSPSYHHHPAHPSSKREPASIILDSVWYFPYERCDPFDLKCSFLVRFTHIYSACRLKRQWCIIYRFSPTVPRLLITTCV